MHASLLYSSSPRSSSIGSASKQRTSRTRASSHNTGELHREPPDRSPGGSMEGDAGRKEEATPAAKAQRGAASFGVSVQEWVQHVKASFLGLARKATARSEQEAAEADMRAAKMQVEATDEAEAKKKHLTTTG